MIRISRDRLWVPISHKGPPLDTLQLTRGRKVEIRHRRIGLLLVRVIGAMSGMNPVTRGWM